MLAVRVDPPRRYGEAEATEVLPQGRVSPQDLGIWSDDQVEPSLRDQVKGSPRKLSVHRRRGKCGYE
jgi:hypothetical protein